MGERERVLLHIGCGPKTRVDTTHGFRTGNWREIRLDVEPSARPDVVADMTNLRQLDSGSVDAIFSSHNLEHLRPHEVPLALAEFVRVLGDDGFVVMTCPDLQALAEFVAQGMLTETLYMSRSGPIAPIDVLFGNRGPIADGYEAMTHRTGFTARLLAATLLRAGFGTALVGRREKFLDLWALAARPVLTPAALRALAQAHFPPQVETALLADETLLAIPPMEGPPLPVPMPEPEPVELPGSEGWGES